MLGKLDRGGIETWLVQLLSQIDRTRYQMDFLVHTADPGAYDNEVLALGAKIIPCPSSRSPLQYARDFRRILQEHGPYDCVHSHVRYYTGYVLLLARLNGVPIRIAHTHTGNPEEDATLQRRLYRSAMRTLIRRSATAGIAVSTVAGDTLIPNWKSDPRWHLIPYGVDTTRFRIEVDALEVRKELGIPSDRWVVGHVGRFVDVKNHQHIVRIAKTLCRPDSNIHFVLIGDGPLRESIRSQIAASGLIDRFTFVGLRSDVPRLLLGAMDSFIFPSKYEGLPIALIEAQLAGLPCVASSAVTQEVVLNPAYVTWLSLAEPAEMWAEAVQRTVHQSKLKQLDCEIVKQMSISSCTSKLEHLYDSLSSTRPAVVSSTDSASQYKRSVGPATRV